jgi:ribosome-binding factor A
MQWNRSDRLSENIRQEISEIVEYELSDDRIKSVTIASVKMSEDLKNVTIFVNIDGDKQQIKDALNALRHATGFIRYHLAQRLQLKRVPELSFSYDDTMSKAARIEQLLGEEIEREQKT